MSSTPPRPNPPAPDGREPAETFDHIWKGWTEAFPREQRIAQHRDDRARFLWALETASRKVSGCRILEVGCGSAIDLCLLSQKLQEAIPIGLDISLEALGAARTFARHLDARTPFCCGDLFALPFDTGTFHLVFSQGVLEHFPCPAEALREQIRVLAPGGTLVVSVPQTYTGYTIHKRRAIRHGTWPWGWEGQFTARQLSELGRHHKLEIAEIFGYQYWRSWSEPAFVLRDLWGKLHRRNPLAASPPFNQIHRLYERIWKRLESQYGHWFLQNLVVVFRKPERIP